MLLNSGWTLSAGRLVPLVALAVIAAPVLAQELDPCFEQCHAEAMDIYDDDTDTTDPDWQEANEAFFECLDECSA